MKRLAEIPLKQFLAEEAMRLNLNPIAVYRRIKRGKYPQLKIRRVNKHIMFVQNV